MGIISLQFRSPVIAILVFSTYVIHTFLTRHFASCFPADFCDPTAEVLESLPTFLSHH